MAQPEYQLGYQVIPAGPGQYGVVISCLWTEGNFSQHAVPVAAITAQPATEAGIHSIAFDAMQRLAAKHERD